MQNLKIRALNIGHPQRVSNLNPQRELGIYIYSFDPAMGDIVKRLRFV